jgi:site-specific recombinase XerD
MTTDPTRPAPARITTEFVSTPRLLDLLPTYRAHLVGRGRRPRGVQDYHDTARTLFHWLGDDATIADLTTEAITRYRDERAAAGRATATVRFDLCVARSFCTFLIRRDMLRDDPTRFIDFPRAKHCVPRALKRDMLRLLMEAIEQPRQKREWAHTWERSRLGVILFLYTGLRLSEVASLLWEDVELETSTIIVRDGKGGKARSVPIHPRLDRELRTIADRTPARAIIPNRDGTPMHPKNVAEIFTRWLRRRGVTITAHQLRHTFATELLRAGAPLPDIQAALGHASLETTQVYLLVDAEHLRKSIDLLPAGW